MAGKRSVIPYGPQHPVLPEPVHIDLVIEDEKVIEAIPNIGFVHRGLEGLAEKKDFNELGYVAERTCGICSFMHGMGYYESLEHVFGVEPPIRAKYLRTMWCEMSRIHSHMLWLGLMADAFGFESLFYQAWRIREKILDMVELTTGGRLISSVNKVGGVLRDVTDDMFRAILKNVGEIETELKEVQKVFMDDYTVQARMKGVGVISREKAHELGAAGPVARASGINTDMRMRGYDAYGDIDFEPVFSMDGDCYARCDVRIREIFQAISIIRQVIEKMPKEKDLSVPVKGNPDGEYFMRVEQPRGEAHYFVKGNGTRFLERFRIRTPTFANIPSMCEMLKGADLSDVGILIVTIDPCISCTER